jgi:hypothetical protein
MLKFLWIAGQKRLDKMMEFEERSGLPYPNGHKTFGELTKVAALHMQFEFRASVLKRNDGLDIDISQLDPIAQEFAQLSDVDRNIMHNLQRRFVKLIAEDPDDDGSTLEKLGIKREEAVGAEQK